MKYFCDVDLPVFEGLIEELESMELNWFQPSNPLSAQQICLNAPVGYTDDIGFGAGFFADFETFIRHTAEGDVEIPLKPSSVYKWQLCDVFKGTMFEEVYNTLHNNIKPGRIRLMKSAPRTCMNWHKDPISRIHYPIQTGIGCFMIIEDETHHLAANKWCFTETGKGKHTAVNASDIDRIHLVVDVLP